MTGIAERLPRLLSLVPYLLARPGVRIADAAADFGTTERQLRRDLELLWMCGLPGYGPGDLVDLSFSGDTVTVTEDAGMRRPVRLTTAEATALLVALRSLGDVPGIVDTAAVRRAILKIESNRFWKNIETYEPAVDDAFASAWSAVLALHRAIP